MAVGNQANLTQASVNAYAAQMALQMRNTCQQSLAFNAAIVALGLAGLEAIGFSPADAQTMINMAADMAQVAGVYNGTVQSGGTGGTGAILFNFQNALTALTGLY